MGKPALDSDLIGFRPLRMLRAVGVVVLVQALMLLMVVVLTIPSYVDDVFHPLRCGMSWCLDYRVLTFALTALTLGPPALLLLVTYLLWRRPVRWPAALPLLVDVVVVVVEVFDPHLLADQMSFALNRRPSAPAFTGWYVAMQTLLILIPAVVSLTVVVALLRRWNSQQSAR